MSIPVHETDQGWIVAYAPNYNEWTGRPIRSEPWLSVDEARERYESGRGTFEAAEAAERDSDHLLHARWAIGITRREMVRVHFFNRASSILASATYVEREGRLFLTQRADYIYPDQDSRYGQDQSVQTISSTFKFDGRGFYTMNDKVTKEVLRTKFKDGDLSTLWFNWPAFGDWDVFLDLNNGILPPDTAMTPL